MPLNELRGTWTKIERAREHVRDIEERIEAFKARHPHAVIPRPDGRFQFDLLEPVPLSWSAILGDAFHNMRGALDIMVNELALARGNTSDAKREAEQRFVAPLRAHLNRAGVGHVSEIADGAAPIPVWLPAN